MYVLKNSLSLDLIIIVYINVSLILGQVCRNNGGFLAGIIR